MIVEAIKRKKKFSVPYLVLYIFLAIVALTILVPICWVLLQSFKAGNEFTNGGPLDWPKQFLIGNYAKVWQASSIGTYFLNSVLITGVALGLSLLLCVPSSYVLSRFKFIGSGLIFAILSAGVFINVNYIVRPMYMMINQFGFSLGMDSLLTNNQFTIAIVYAVNSCSFGIFLLSGYLRTLPKGYEEAAKIDGCGYFGTLFKIVLPLSLPGVLTVVLFNFFSYWNEYLIVSIFVTNSAAFSMMVGLMNVKTSLANSSEWGQIYAGFVIAMLPTLVLYCVAQDKLTKGMSIGGLKG